MFKTLHTAFIRPLLERACCVLNMEYIKFTQCKWYSNFIPAILSWFSLHNLTHWSVILTYCLNPLRDLYVICMWSACDLHVICMYLHVICMYLHVTCMWPACDLHVTCMWPACDLHVIRMWPLHDQIVLQPNWTKGGGKTLSQFLSVTATQPSFRAVRQKHCASPKFQRIGSC